MGKAPDVAGKSLRRCPPRLSSRAVAAAMRATATSLRLASSPLPGASRSSRPRRRRASRRCAPPRRPSSPAAATRPFSLSVGASPTGTGYHGGQPPAPISPGSDGPGCRMGRRAPVASGPSFPGSTASIARAPNTMPSSSEFDARRLAPWTPVHATSPAAHRPGSAVAPSRSVRMPPQR